MGVFTQQSFAVPYCSFPQPEVEGVMSYLERQLLRLSFLEKLFPFYRHFSELV